MISVPDRLLGCSLAVVVEKELDVKDLRPLTDEEEGGPACASRSTRGFERVHDFVPHDRGVPHLEYIYHGHVISQFVSMSKHRNHIFREYNIDCRIVNGTL